MIRLILTLFFPYYLIAQSPLYPEMVLVEGGTFAMGDNWGEGFDDALPLHNVTLSNFSISKTEVTIKQYRQFCKETGCKMPDETIDGPYDSPLLDAYPMVYVTWADAVAYCKWLGRKLGGNYRLPTEAEWEYAARGGKFNRNTKYSGGNSMDYVGWYEDNSKEELCFVAKKKPNELGIYDMSGNVWEWCLDWYDEEYYITSPSTNPKGPSTGTERVIRGGSYYSPAFYSRVNLRFSIDPEEREGLIGFRVVLTQ
jgi:formylglycine-generating enzyme